MGVRRDTLYNLVGSIAPLGVSLLTIPPYLRIIGDARYGILSIVWLFIGYFAVFDFGLSRSTAYHLACLVDHPDEERSRVFWTAMALNASFGAIGGLILYPIALVCFSHFFKMPADIRQEVLASLPWLILSVPLATIGGALNGTLDARKRFAFNNGINLVGTAIGQVVPLGTALVLGPSLTNVIPAAVIARTATMVPLFIGAIRFVPAGWPRRAEASVIRDLFKYGGWVSISNLISPLLATLDKILIGVILGAVDVTYYAIPDRLTRQGSILPGAIVRALFPAMAAATPEHAQEQAKAALDVLSAALTLMITAGVLVMPVFFWLWIGKSFAQIATPIGVLLALGIHVNGLAYVPSSLLQARGRVDLTAKFHLIEIVPHIICLYLGLRYFGLLGAAGAMLLVSILDAILLCGASRLRLWRQPGFWVSVVILGLSVLSATELSPQSPKTYLISSLILLAAAAYAVLSLPPVLRRQIPWPMALRAKHTIP